MRRAFNWMGACTVLALAVFVASCDDGPTNVPDQASAPTVTETTPTADDPLFATYPGTTGVCMGNDAVTYNANVDGFNDRTSPLAFNCTSGDVVIANASAKGGGAITCVEGETFQADIVADVVENAESERVDIGIWIENGDNGTGGAEDGACDFFFFDGADIAAPDPYPIDVDGDECGDMANKGTVNDFDLEQLTLVCPSNPVIENGKTYVEVASCVSWTQPGGDRVCYDGDGETGFGQNPRAGTLPANKSKCNCEPFLIEVNIIRKATVQVVKSLSPATDPGTFDLEIKDWEGTTVGSATAVGDGGDTGAPTEIQWNSTDEPTKNKASVAEPGANLNSLNEGTTPSAFDFYTTTYSCLESNNGNGPVNGSGTGPVDLTLENGDAWVCTFTNTRIPAPAVTVTKTADEAFDRDWAWTLDKDVFKNGAVSGDCSSFDGGSIENTTQALQLGQDLRVCYQVTATGSGPTDTNHSVSGTISVSVASSTAPYSGTFAITDVITPGDIASTDVDCDDQTSGNQNTGLTVAQGGSLSCTYSISLTEAQANAATTNTATAAYTWNTGDYSGSDGGTAAVDFSSATPTTEDDETADITDIWNGTPVFTLGDDVLASSGANVYVFSRDLSCPDYGSFLIENDAFLLSVDGGYDLTDPADVSVSCPRPPDGCTLTQGFWRTHSTFGPAPYDEGWQVIPGGAAALFGLPSIESGESYYDVLWDPGKGGNAFYKLAHQYIAAYLNIENGADPTPVSSYMTDAASILDYYDTDASPNNTIPKRGSDWCGTQGAHPCTGYNSDRQYAMYLNNKLTQYNEGLLGVPHCDDDAQSLLTTNR